MLVTALGDLRVILSSAGTSREKGAKQSIIFFLILINNNVCVIKQDIQIQRRKFRRRFIQYYGDTLQQLAGGLFFFFFGESILQDKHETLAARQRLRLAICLSLSVRDDGLFPGGCRRRSPTSGFIY